MDVHSHEESLSMTGSDDREWLVGVRPFRPGGEGDETPDCLDDDAIAALAEGVREAEVRSAWLLHLADCRRCRRAVASVARTLTDPDLAREVRAIEFVGRRSGRRWGHLALGLAAAGAVLLLAWPSQIVERPSPHRAAPITAAPAAEAVWPVGAVGDARSLRWTPVSGADRYRVTVFDADGAVRYEAELTGTEAALPDSLPLAPGVRYWWKVDARLGFDRWAASPLIEFSIGGEPRR